MNLTSKLFTDSQYNYSNVEYLNIVNRTSPGKGSTILDIDNQRILYDLPLLRAVMIKKYTYFIGMRVTT